MITALNKNFRYRILKHHLYKILEKNSNKYKASYYVNIFISTLICLNILAVIIETVDDIYLKYGWFLDLFETFSVMIFSIEYIARLWICTQNTEYGHSFYGRLKYIFSTYAIIDLLAILPFFLSLAIDLSFFRVIRLLRLLRLLKIVRYVKAFRIIKKVLIEKKEELNLSLVFVAVMLLIVSCMMYFVEREAQPEAFSSIPETMWWGIATLTTVGYGDVYPITKLGKFFAAIVAVLGIGLFALPTGILASGFSEAIKKKEKKTCKCPHCGKNVPLED